MADSHKAKQSACYDNREISWLKFNKRVLEEAADGAVPLCERLSFANIFVNNLDEFYMVRVGAIHDRMSVSKVQIDNKTGLNAREQLTHIYKNTKSLLKMKDKVYLRLMNEIKGQGVEIVSFKGINKKNSEYLEDYFRNSIMPILSPQVIGKKQPFPFLNNKDIYAVALLETKNSEKLCIVPCSNEIFERLVPISSDTNKYILIEELILHFMSIIFDRYTVKSKSLIRIIRSADIDVDEIFCDEDIDYRASVEELIKIRKRLNSVKLECSRDMDDKIIKHLCKELGLNSEQVFYSKSPLELSFVYKIQDMLRKNKKLFFNKRTPANSDFVDENRSMINQIAEKDILLRYPFESINPYLRLLKEAGKDERVVSIKMTLYRVASNSQIVEALIDAAENGKEVMVMVELRARFDEKNNIKWSRRMENAGCRIIYGIDYIKVHSKICLISYVDNHTVRYISQIGTGNYNEITSKIYTDLSLMTSNENIAMEVAETFNRICMEQLVDKTEHLLVAPRCLQKKVIDMIDMEIEQAKNGQNGYIGLKINSITDKEIIDKLIEASRAGVKVEMIVRGICCLIPQVKGYTENITVQSIVGRYLEHSRIYIFGTEDRDKIFISSADFMTRNTLRRVEVATPIYDKYIKDRLRNMFNIMLKDNVKARVMDSRAHYHKKKIKEGGVLINSQEYFFEEDGSSC